MRSGRCWSRCCGSRSGPMGGDGRRRIAAAQLLGIGKTTAYRKVKQYGLATGIGAGYCPNCGRRLSRHVARLHKDAMVRDNGRVRKPCKVRNK